MSRKAKTITFISLTCLIGLITLFIADLSLNLMCHLRGYIGYCSAVRLPAIFPIIVSEIILTTLTCCLYIYSEYYPLSKKVLTNVLLALAMNTCFIAYHFIQYPLLIKVSSIWNSSLTSDTVLIHPLLYVSIAQALIMLLITYRNKLAMNRISVKIIAGIPFLLLAIEVVMLLNTTYERCFG